MHHIAHFRDPLKCAIQYTLNASDTIPDNKYSNNKSWSIVAQGMFQLLDTSLMVSQTFQNPERELNIVHEVNRHSLW